MNVERLRALVVFRRDGDLRTAAASCGVSPDTLRKRLSELELELGAPVVSKIGRKLELSEAGLELASGAGRLIAKSEALLDRIRARSGRRGRFRVAITQGMYPEVLAPIIAARLGLHPEIQAVHLPAHRPLSLLPEQADIAITFEPRPKSGPWLSTVVARAQERLFASRAYLERHGTPASIEDLHEHALLSWTPPLAPDHSWPLLGGGDHCVSLRFRSPSLDLLRQIIRSGGGIGRLPELPRYACARELVPVLPEQVGRSLALRIVGRDTPATRGVLRTFIGDSKGLLKEFGSA